MACALTTDFLLDCAGVQGGLKTAYFIEFDNVDSYTEASGTVTAITKSAGKIFRKYELVLDTASMTETPTKNRQNGSLFYAQALTIIVNKLRASLRNELKLLAQNRLIAVVETMEGTAFMLGATNGLELSGGSATSGTASGDRNGLQIDFTGQEPEPMFAVQASVLTGLQT